MKNKNKNSILPYYDREAPEVIEARRLISNISHMTSSKEGKPQIIAITSATLGEGKSTIASLMALTASDHTDKRVLLVDTDIRRPKIHELFNLNVVGGFIDVLNNGLALKDSFKSTPLENLKVITAGKRQASPSKFINNDNIKAFSEEAKFYFDFIIMDCAPIVPVSDVIDLSPEIDGALMVIKAGKTPREVTQRAVDLLSNAGVNILGVILNDVGRVLPYYYDYSYYNYQSSSAGVKKSRKRKIKE
ncbi:MAG: polysaccharide biosynthesis tyrosine autokinase [candidate division Zixibacteria bacterium]|nr:polysaccharide biosynthesis tyrosine autokinase [candidate division Zixibacteria bacterium]